MKQKTPSWRSAAGLVAFALALGCRAVVGQVSLNAAAFSRPTISDAREACPLLPLEPCSNPEAHALQRVSQGMPMCAGNAV